MTRSADKRSLSPAKLERLAEWSMRKPVIALMGEFSAGKSTLLNLLIGQDILPTQVTATRMPPVWLRYGDAPAVRVDREGRKHPVDLRDHASIPIQDTAYIQLSCQADILRRCDLMDTPGISDPNIKAEDWLRTVRYANAVMWCTNASQAWRASEQGAWEALPSRLRQTSILLVTRKDKIASELDLKKIDRRLERETSNLFNARMFVSLTRAIRAREAGNAEAWANSGAQKFSDMLEQIVEGVGVQRSFMFARYVTPGEEAVQAPDTASIETRADDVPSDILGFVAKDGADQTGPTAEQTADVAVEPLEAAQSAPVAAEWADTPDAPAPKKEKVNLANYTLRDPSHLRPPEEQDSGRTNLATYRLKDHATARTEMTTGAEDTAAPPEAAADGPSETDLIRMIWQDVQENHDISSVPSLVAAVERLIGATGAGSSPDHGRKEMA